MRLEDLTMTRTGIAERPRYREFLGGLIVLFVVAGVLTTRGGLPRSGFASPVDGSLEEPTDRTTPESVGVDDNDRRPGDHSETDDDL